MTGVVEVLDGPQVVQRVADVDGVREAHALGQFCQAARLRLLKTVALGDNLVSGMRASSPLNSIPIGPPRGPARLDASILSSGTLARSSSGRSLLI